jgi:hypothetical protein
MRKELPIYLGIATCVVVLSDFFVKAPALQAASQNLQDWIIVISAWAMCLGATSLVIRHSEIVSKRMPNWKFSIALFVGLLAFPLAAIFGGGRLSKPVLFIYDSLFGPIGATLFSILVFYTASAAYRTFRLKNLQAGLLLISAVLLMIGKVPIGNVIWSGFPPISDWIMKVPVASANRGILIGGAVGTMAAGIRYLIGLERSNIEG